MYLLDTNIWLERLLEQETSEDVAQFLDKIPSDQILITDFAFHSIGVVLNRLGRRKDLLSFVQDLFLDGAVHLASLQPEDMRNLIDIMDTFGLDFDDAYQYGVAANYDAILVSFDSDFDRTKLGKMTPSQILTS